MRRTALPAVGAFALGSLTLVASQASLPQTTFHAGVDLVQLPVSVLDTDRKPVRGLTAADFTIREDGQPQSIVAFQAVDIPAPVIPRTAWMREVAPDVATNRPLTGRLVVVLFNDGITRSNYWSEQTASRIADKVLEQIGPDDLVAVTYLRQNTTAQTFTSDRSLIRAAFTEIHNKGPLPLGSKSICFGPGALAVEELLRVADALEGDSGSRKAILYVTPTFPRFPTLDACVNAEMADFLRKTQRSNISVYPIDPGVFMGGVTFPMISAEIGGRPPMTPGTVRAFASPDIVNSRAGGLEGLRYLADSTGGRAVINDKHDNPEAELPSIFEENSTYYLLGFQSTNATIDQRYRKLSVTVNRPGLTVHHRDGYYPGPPKTTKKPALTPLEQAETGPRPAPQLPLRLAAAPIWVPGKKNAAVAIAVGAEEDADAPEAVAHISVLTAAFDIEGKSQGELRQHFDLPVSASTVDSRSFEVLSRLDLPPGRYDLRVALEDDGGRRGSVFNSLEVPDFTKGHLALSGATIARDSARTVTPKDAFAGLLPLVPTSERSFARTDRVQVFLKVYEPSGEARPATVTMTMTDDANRRVFERTTDIEAAQFGKSRTVDYRADLPLNTLEPGAHLLTISATADQGKATAERRVRFDAQ